MQPIENAGYIANQRDLNFAPSEYENMRTDPLAPETLQDRYRPTRPEGNLRSGLIGGVSTLGGVLNKQSSELRAVQEFAGDVANTAFPIHRAVGDRLPYVPTPGGVAEALVPTRVWEVALSLAPGIGDVDDLVRAFKAGVPAARMAVKDAAEQLGETGIARRLASETGALGGKGAPEDILAAGVRAEGDVASGGPSAGGSVTSPSSPVSVVLDTLSRAEQMRLTLNPNFGDVMKIAERYERDSVQRGQLVALANQSLEHIDPVRRKFITSSLETLPTKAERKIATKAQRARQAGGAEIAFKGEGTTQEKATAALKAMGGKQPQRFTPIGDRFTDAESAELFQRIEQANADGTLTSIFDAPKATSALSLLMTGERLAGVASEAAKPNNLMPSEIKLLGQIFGPEFEAAIPRSARHMDAFRSMVDLLNLPRALVTAVDISAAGRQGIMLAPRNPLEVAKSFPKMIQAMASEEGFARAAANLRGNKYFEDALAHHLELANIGGGVEGEEAFISAIASRLPFIRGSERGFVMYLDTLRMLTYEKSAARWERLAQKKGWDVERLDLVKNETARFLNHASGRGSVGGAKEFIPALNAIFFAPRFLISRPQSIWDMVRPGATVQSRQLAFENLGAFVGAGVAALAAAKQFGADVELDPRSSDFGKMKWGNTRIEFWGGFQPIARYIAQISTAERKNLTSGKIEYAYPGTSALRFFRSKLAPGGALIYDYTAGQGKGYGGEDLLFNPSELRADKESGQVAWNVFGKRIVPLSIQAAIEGYQASGTTGAVAAGALSAIGGGVGSFEPSEDQEKKAAKDKYADQLTELSDIQSAGDIAVESYNSKFPEYALEATTWDGAVEELKAFFTERGQDYRDSVAYKTLEDYASNIRQFEREKDPKIDAYYIIVTGQGKPLTEEAQKIIKDETGITIALNQNAD